MKKTWKTKRTQTQIKARQEVEAILTTCLEDLHSEDILELSVVLQSKALNRYREQVGQAIHLRRVAEEFEKRILELETRLSEKSA